MKFVYVSILDMMIDLYKKPRNPQSRFFDGYLKLIQTPDKKDMQRPLPFFNPMGKEHILKKLESMKSMGFEKEMEILCQSLSTLGKEIKVYFNLADDIGGGRTNKENTHQQSIKIKPFIKRGFCVVVFYASEDITKTLIAERMKFYANLYNNYDLE